MDDLKPNLEPLQFSSEFDNVESDIKQIFIDLFEEYLRKDERDLNVYGMPHLGSFDLVSRNVETDRLALINNDDEPAMRYLHKAWKARNPKRGLHFLKTYLQLLWPNAWEAAQMWQDKAVSYPDKLDREEWIRDGDPSDTHYLTSRIMAWIIFDNDPVTREKIEPALRSSLGAKFLLELRALLKGRSDIGIGSGVGFSVLTDHEQMGLNYRCSHSSVAGVASGVHVCDLRDRESVGLRFKAQSLTDLSTVAFFQVRMMIDGDVRFITPEIIDANINIGNKPIANVGSSFKSESVASVPESFIVNTKFYTASRIGASATLTGDSGLASPLVMNISEIISPLSTIGAALSIKGIDRLSPPSVISGDMLMTPVVKINTGISVSVKASLESPSIITESSSVSGVSDLQSSLGHRISDELRSPDVITESPSVSGVASNQVASSHEIDTDVVNPTVLSDDLQAETRDVESVSTRITIDEQLESPE